MYVYTCIYICCTYMCVYIKHTYIHRDRNEAPHEPAPPNYPLRDPKCHPIESIRLLIEVHWGV